MVEALDYNHLLYRWFVGLGIDDRIWGHSTFSQNRDRQFNEWFARVFFERVKMLAEWGKLTSDENFSVDRTLIEAKPIVAALDAVRRIVEHKQSFHETYP